MQRRQFVTGVIAAPLAAAPLVAATPAAAAPSARLIPGPWRRFGKENGPDHAAWTAFLKRYRLDGRSRVALVDYAAAKRSGRRALDAYLRELQATDPTRLTRPAAFAFWANLYNAQTIALVLEAYPVSSIKRVRGGIFGTGPWKDKVMRVAGRELSLDDVEHGVMRPVWRDPRIHYAVNCAAIGCPNLQGEAWTPENLNAELDQAAIAFVNHPRGARVERGRLTVSSIYDWFQADFGGSEQGVIRHLRRYAGARLRRELKGIDRIRRDEYDWALNDV